MCKMSSIHFRLGSHGSVSFPVMQKFEKVPESKVIFDANSPVIVKSKVPGADSPLVQCLAGKPRGNAHMERQGKPHYSMG